MFEINGWEVFYAPSKNTDNGTDQISIDERNKRFILDTDAVEYFTDDCEGQLQWLHAYCYVSRFVFELIVDSLKAKGFSELTLKK